MLELFRNRGRGLKAPALHLAAPPPLLGRFWRTSRGYVSAIAGVAVAAVAVVSLLTWLAPNSDRPIPHPTEVINRILPEMLEQVDEQMGTLLLGAGKESVLQSVREGLESVSSGIGSIASASSSSVSPSSPSILPISGTEAPTSEDFSQTTNEELPPQEVSGEPLPTETSEPPPAGEESSPPVVEEPPPPTTEEPPLTEEPPPVTEEPPATEVPPSSGTDETPPVTAPING